VLRQIVEALYLLAYDIRFKKDIKQAENAVCALHDALRERIEKLES
jgi:hypothetical protein